MLGDGTNFTLGTRSNHSDVVGLIQSVKAGRVRVTEAAICQFVFSRDAVKHVYLSMPKPPFSSLITPYSSEKVDFPERRPVGVTKVKLAVSALPEHETRHLSTGADDQIGIRAIICIQEFLRRFWG